MGIFCLTALNIYSRRFIQKMWIDKTGQKIKVKYYNAFWIPKTIEYPASEFAGAEPSFGHFTKTEIISFGNVWLLKDASIYKDDIYIKKILDKVLDGHPVKLANYDRYDDRKKQRERERQNH